ncbi:MAG: ABC transporter ATP-binding protein [Flavobacteriaceae bacterium]
MALLEIEELGARVGGLSLLDGVSLSLNAGETLGLVGESGSGKSLTALSAMQLVPPQIALAGSIRFAGRELAGLSDDAMSAIRGNEIGMIFQEPMTSLNPVMRIGDQVAEGFRLHLKLSRREAAARADAVLDRVGLAVRDVPRERYPHQLSGGQRQRVVIAMAIALEPKLLIADEPTTALDVTVQAEIVALLKGLTRERGTALLFISHDLAVVAECADRIAILREGRIVEQGRTRTVLKKPGEAYTKRLISASSHVPARARHPVTWAGAEGEPPLLSVENVTRVYRQGHDLPWRDAPRTLAVDGVSFRMHAGQSVGLVGESGCGKSTLARTILGLESPQAGRIVFDGAELGTGDDAARRNLQVVFQDPFGSFDPRHRAGRIVAEPLHLMGRELDPASIPARVAEALREVHLDPADARKFPHEFSGGQRQRLAIARALITRPKLIVADEPVSALDVSIRAQILDLVAELRDRLGLAFLFISHDLTVVRAITDDCLVMHRGRIVERGPTAEVLASPGEAYTRRLVAAAPDLAAILRKRR